MSKIGQAILNFFRAQPQFDPETGTWQRKDYPCGCTATGTAELPNYCPEHGPQCDTCLGSGDDYKITSDGDEIPIACPDCKGTGFKS